MALDNAVRNNVLDALNGVSAFVASTTPAKVRLMTSNGSVSANGTELGTGAGSGSGAGYTAGGQSVTWAAASAGAAVPTATVRWDNMPTCTIVGVEVWDSAGTPRRIHWGAMTAPKTLASGDSFELPPSSFSETLA